MRIHIVMIYVIKNLIGRDWDVLLDWEMGKPVSCFLEADKMVSVGGYFFRFHNKYVYKNDVIY